MRAILGSISALRLAVIAVVLFVGAFGFASATAQESPAVPIQFDRYIHRVDGAPADPINVIFVASTPDQVAAALHQVTGWGVVDGSPMLFVDDGASRRTAWQFGMQFSRESRWHMRIEDARREGQGEYILAAVHRDDNAPCGHVGTAFDRARDHMVHAFTAAGYDVTTLALDNTKPGRQCDGSYTAGDGAVAVIDLATPPHPTQSTTARR